MKPKHEPQLQAPHFDRSAWLLTAFVVLFLLTDIAQLVYRYTLPTDGWSVQNVGDNAYVWVYGTNLVGAPSGVLPGDVIQSVDGQVVAGQKSHITGILDFIPAPPNWQVGKTVVITVERGREMVAVSMPVTHWTPWAVWRLNTSDPIQVVNLLGSLVILILVWFIFLRRPEAPSARALLMVGSAACSPTISGLLPDGLSMMFNKAAFILSSFFVYATWIALLAPAVLAFTLYFPQPKRIIQRHAWLGLLPFVFGLIELVGLYTLRLNDVGVIANDGPAILFAASIISLIHSGFTQRDPTSRAQLRWVIGGFVMTLGLNLLSIPFYNLNNPVINEILNIISGLGGIIIGVSLGIAVLRYHLYEIDVIIRKTLVYTLLTGLLALIYFGSVILLDNLVSALTGQQHSSLVLVVSTLAIAALFNPLRRQIQVAIDRSFYRKKYNAEQALESFNLSIRDQVDLDAMTETLLEVVGRTLQPEFLGLWLSLAKPAYSSLSEPATSDKPIPDHN